MKSTLTFFLLLFITLQSFSQDTIVPVVKKNQWYHHKEYDYLITSKLFKDGMTDDEMAGILLYKGGREMTGSFVAEVFGVVIGSVAVVVYPKNNTTGTALAIGSGISFIVGIVNLLSGYSKISKAGIILQHKGINMKATASGISLNF
ncbi:MAG: hypothetical protein WCK34_00555 [Bacteroidota bacterium]